MAFWLFQLFLNIVLLNGNFHLGEQYLKIVEKAKKPSKFVNSLYEEVKRNKQFYQFRVGENYVPLILVNRKSNYRNEWEEVFIDIYEILRIIIDNLHLENFRSSKSFFF